MLRRLLPFFLAAALPLTSWAEPSKTPENLRNPEQPIWGRNSPIPRTLQELEKDPQLLALLAQMSWEEKCGQLNQYAGEITGPQPLKPELEQRIVQGQVGSVLSISGVDRCRKLQDSALKSRLKIPLLFAMDVIHGYRTVFPIPLAEAASFDPEIAEQDAKISAQEAAASGVHLTFAPMVDIARDCRWGRVIEGAGEDPHLGQVMARARVRGFQGRQLGQPDRLAACVKHFAGYGAAEGGRDYDTSEISERTMREVYLPPFQAAMEEGVATLMPSFQETAGLPSTANPWLLRQVLRQDWGFEGVVISDYGAIEELTKHRICQDKLEAGKLALSLGVDIDMMSDIYRTLPVTPELQASLDRSVLRLLALKKALGLFEDPYRFLNQEREKKTQFCQDFRLASCRAAEKSAVLLENRQQLLPLEPQRYKRVSVIGPLADDAVSTLGEWNLVGRPEETITAWKGLREGFGACGSQVQLEKGCPAYKADSSKIAAAKKLALQSDLVVLVLGEPAEITGESRNRTFVGLPGSQLELARAIAATGKPVVTVLMNGRPLALSELRQICPTLLEMWHPGTEGGRALFNLLRGSASVGGKLPMSFPTNSGQLPIYYNRKSSGRAPEKGADKYKMAYYDSSIQPLYPFGYGLSYSSFAVSPARVVSAPSQWPLVVECTVKNTGKRKADEVVQLYVSDEVRSLTPPVKELKGFSRVSLDPGQSRTLQFRLNPGDLSFIDQDMHRVFEPGSFGLATGTDSRVPVQTRVKLSTP